MLSQLKTRTKILCAFCLALMVTLAVGYIGYRGIANIGRNVAEIGEIRLPSVEQLNCARRGQLTAAYAIRGMIHKRFMHNAETRRSFFADYEGGMERMKSALKAYEALPSDPQEQSLYKEFMVDLEKWKAAVEPILGVPREERRLLDAGTKPEDKRILDLEDKAFAQAMSLKEELNSAGEKLVKVLDYNVQAGEKQTSEARATLASSIWTILIVVGLSTGVMLAAGVVLARTISRTLRALIDETCRLSAAAVEGQLQTRGNPELVTPEFRPIVEGVNTTLDAVIGPLNVAAEYVDRISKGDIPARITDTYNGDFNEIKNNLNQCIDVMNGLLRETNALIQATQDGKLQTRGNAAVHRRLG